MTNFNNVRNALIDGTKDVNVNAGTFAGTLTANGALTVAGVTTMNGNVVCGDATTDTTTVTGELLGSRVFLVIGVHGSTLASSDGYLPFSQTGTTTTGLLANSLGVVMPRAGSIVGYSLMAHCINFTSNITFELEIHKNASNLFTGGSVAVTGTGFQSTYGTFARGTHTFVAGDRMSAYIDVTSAGSVLENLTAAIEIQFNT